MANSKISALTNYTTPDGVNDVIPIVDNANTQTKKITRNNYLGITGNPVGHTDTQTLSNKTLGNTNTISLKGTLFTLQDDSDTSKQARFVMSGITTATTRSYTLPNATGTLVDLASSQTLTNKTLTSPVITGGSYDNGSITVDSISGHTLATIVSVAGLSISNGVLNSNSSVKTSNLQSGSVTPDKIALSSATNVIKYDGGGTTAFTTTSASYVDVTGLTQPSVTHTTGGVFLVIGHFAPSMTTANTADIGTRVLMDGSTAANIPTGGEVFFTETALFQRISAAFLGIFTGVSAASHTFKVQMKTSAGTAASNNSNVSLIIIPLNT